jgi:hypothetical protein
MKKILALAIVSSFIVTAFAQTSKIGNIKNVDDYKINNLTGSPSFLTIKTSEPVEQNSFLTWIKTPLKMTENDQFGLLKKETDNIGYINYRYQQQYK